MNRFIQIQGYLCLVIEYSFFGQSVLLHEEMRVQSISGTLFLLMLFCFTHMGRSFKIGFQRKMSLIQKYYVQRKIRREKKILPRVIINLRFILIHSVTFKIY